MPAKPKRSAKDKQKAVERYMAKDAGVKQLAKEYGVSEPAIYQWITAARQQASVDARAQVIGAKGMETEARISKDLKIQGLEKENRDLKHKLFELLLKHGEI